MAAKGIKVLLLENDASDAEAIHRALQSSDANFVVQVACSLREYRDRVALGPPDIALLNMVVPDGHSLDVVSSPPEANPFPILMMASHADEKTAVRAIQAGALDYVVKSPQAFAVMPRILGRAMERWQLLQERRQAEESRRLSEQDFRLLATYYKQLNKISISLVEAADTQDLFNRITQTFRLLTGAIAASFSVYNQESRDLKVVSLSIDPVSSDKVSSIFGPESFEMRMPVSADVMQQMLGEGIRRPKDLHELSFGTIPLDISDLVMDAVGCRQIIALAITYAEELVGTCIAYLPGNQPVVPDDALKTYSYISGVVVKRKLMEETLSNSEAQYRLLSEHTTDSVWLMDMNLKTTYHSPSVEKIRGFTPLEIMELPLEQNLTPQSLNLASAMFLEELPRMEAGPDYNPVRILDLEYYCKDGTTAWAENKFSIIRDKSGKPVSILGESRDITERRKVEEALRKSEAQYRLLSEHTTDTIFLLDMDLKMTYHSPSGEKLRGFTIREIMEMPLEQTLAPESLKLASELFFEELPKVVADPGYNPVRTLDLEYSCKDGATVWAESKFSIIRDQHGKPVSILGEGRNITDRKHAEAYREMGREILQILNEMGDLQDSIQRVLDVLKTRTGFDAVGIRLQEGDDFPYFAQQGFSRDFLLTENTLVERAADGGVCRDKDGNVSLECTCGLVISGQTDPANPLFTAGGSSWTNDSFPFLDVPPSEDPRHHPRNQCIHQGYASVALVPIHNKERIVGLIQLNDRRKGRFTLETIELLESIASHIGEAMMRKRAEEAVRESEGRFKSIIEHITDIFYMRDVDRKILYVSPQVEKVLGYSIEEIRNNYTNYLSDSPGNRDGYKRVLLAITTGERQVPYVLEFIHRDGTKVLAEINESPLKNDKGEVIVIVGTARDVTDRMRIEAALRESEEKYRLVVENALEGILIAVDGMFKFINRGATLITGYTQEESTSMPFIEFVHPDDRDMVIDRHLRRLKGEQIPNTFTFRIFCKSGDIKWVELAATFITWERKPATLNFMTDITDRKRMEEEHLRVAKLESIGLLAGGIAHDFNNILTAILGNIDIAKMESASGKEIQNSLEQAEKASLRAKGLTQQLLTFSRGGAPVKKLTSVSELLRDTANFALSGSKVKCHFSIPADLWHAEIDAGQVSQVIHNLVINAQQAMPSGGTIELSAENIALSKTQSLGKGLPLKSGNYTRITVADHGTGIPADHLEKIFDPFFTTKQKGSGLGLATSFSIARNHGGHLSVESKVGAGSTFYLYLPASTQTVTPEQDKIEAPKPAGKARILLMDDEQGIREVAGRMLKHIGYKDIEFAADGAQAVKLYKAAMKSGHPFSVVILDLTIPGGMGGKEAVKKLLKIDPGVKAIISSGYADESVMAEYKEYGFSGMVAKPYSIEQLGKALHNVTG